jgi:hypothetical protein
MEMFYHHFPKLADEETRFVNIIGQAPAGSIPAGSYALVEAYCTDPNCDCRRVLLNVVERDHGHVATISYGFDRDGPEPGPFLDPLNTQSPYAEELMEMIAKMTLHDPIYLARLERHYALMKEKCSGRGVGSPKHRAEQRRRQRRKRGRGKS